MTGWRLLPSLVVRSTGFPWEVVDRLAHRRTAGAADRLLALEAEADRLRAELTPVARLTRGHLARLRNHRPLPPDSPVPVEWSRRWDRLTGRIALARERLAEAAAEDEMNASAAFSALATDPRFLDAVACSGPGVYRDLTLGRRPSARLRRQVASYAQRFATKCETMSFFGPINYATLRPELDAAATLSWQGASVCPGRRAYLSAWAFDRLQAEVLGDPRLLASLVPRRKTLSAPLPARAPAARRAAGTLPTTLPTANRPTTLPTALPTTNRPSGTTDTDRTAADTATDRTAIALLCREADGSRTVAEISARTGLAHGRIAEVLHAAVHRGLLTHDLIPPATEVDPVRWLAHRVADRTGTPDKRLQDVVRSLDRYPGADPATKVRLQAELGRGGRPAEGTSAGTGTGPGAGVATATGTGAGRGGDGSATAGHAGRPKSSNDRVPVTEAAVGTLDLDIGGELARDLAEAVPAALDLLAHVAVRTRERTNRRLARALGPGTFPLIRVLRQCAELPVAHDPWLTDTITRALACAEPDAEEIDLAPLVAEPPAPGLPVLCSVDVMVASADLTGYRSGDTPLVIGGFHDAPLLTPWALQFHSGPAALLADRDRSIEAALGPYRTVSVVARRSTGLPPLRFPGPVVELGPAGDPAERIPLDRLQVRSDGGRARLMETGHDDELFLHNGELDTGVHTALALPRIHPPRPPDVPYLPRLRLGAVVLARRRWRIAPGPEARIPNGPGEDGLALRRWLHRTGLPVRFFAKASHERRPIYVDMDAPLLVEGLRRLARGADSVYAGELLPTPEQLWLREGQRRFAAELRCVYLRAAEPGGYR